MRVWECASVKAYERKSVRACVRAYERASVWKCQRVWGSKGVRASVRASVRTLERASVLACARARALLHASVRACELSSWRFRFEKAKPREIIYRSYQHFNHDNIERDLMFSMNSINLMNRLRKVLLIL